MNNLRMNSEKKDIFFFQKIFYIQQCFRKIPKMNFFKLLSKYNLNDKSKKIKIPSIFFLI